MTCFGDKHSHHIPDSVLCVRRATRVYHLVCVCVRLAVGISSPSDRTKQWWSERVCVAIWLWQRVCSHRAWLIRMLTSLKCWRSSERNNNKKKTMKKWEVQLWFRDGRFFVTEMEIIIISRITLNFPSKPLYCTANKNNFIHRRHSQFGDAALKPYKTTVSHMHRTDMGTTHTSTHRWRRWMKTNRGRVTTLRISCGHKPHTQHMHASHRLLFTGNAGIIRICVSRSCGFIIISLCMRTSYMIHFIRIDRCLATHSNSEFSVEHNIQHQSKRKSNVVGCGSPEKNRWNNNLWNLQLNCQLCVDCRECVWSTSIIARVTDRWSPILCHNP